MPLDAEKNPESASHNPYLTGHRGSSTKHHEWRTAENSASHLLPILKKLVADQPRRTLLDVGAGSGTITADFASYMPEGRVTGTDLSEEILQKAKKYAEARGISNLDVKQGNAYHLPFEDGSFDFVHVSDCNRSVESQVGGVFICKIEKLTLPQCQASMILGHLDQPQLAVGEMIRVA